METSWPFVTGKTSTLPEIVSAVSGGGRPTFAVLDGREFVGIIPPAGLAAGGGRNDPGRAVVASDLMIASPKVVSPEDDLYGTLDLFRHHDSDALPVVDREKGEFLGMLTRDSIVRALRERLKEQRGYLLREHAGFSALAHASLLEGLLSELSMHADGVVDRMNVPSDAVGKSLIELNFRQHYQCEVIAVQSLQDGLLAPPDPKRPFEAGDILVLFRGGAPRGAGPPAGAGESLA
jgi:CBS-domain-containing membrane protein